MNLSNRHARSSLGKVLTGSSLAMLCFWVGCGSQELENQQDPPIAESSPAHLASNTETPKRIVSLAPSVTEWLYQLGAGESLAGRTDFCMAPEEARHLPSIGRMDQPNLEALVGLNPDLVIATTMTPEATVSQIKGLGIPVERHNHEGIDGLMKSIDQIGEIIGQNEAALEARATVTDALKQNAQPASGQLPRVLILLHFDPPFAAGPGSFPYELVQRLGYPQVTDGLASKWPRLGDESIVALAPEILVVASGKGREDAAAVRTQWEQLRQTPVWRETPAAKNNGLVIIPRNLLTIPGPKLSEAIIEIARQLDIISSGE